MLKIIYSSKVIVRTHTHRKPTDCSTRTVQVDGKNNKTKLHSCIWL